MPWRVTLAVLLLVSMLGPSAVLANRQSALPPVTYVCPMPEHSTVAADAPGKCPICGMTLVPVRIDLAWSCPIHPIVIKDKAGQCPIDHRDLVQVAVSTFWTCPEQPHDHLMSPGKCADGSARKLIREHRAHGDHNPKHGGQLFMASDNWHHIEATHPRGGLFRVFVYDNFTQPMLIKGIAARIVLHEEWDPQKRSAREIDVLPLKPGADGRTLEARVDRKLPLPVTMAIKARFNAGEAEQRFDFTFANYSKDPSPVLASAPPPKGMAVPVPVMPAALAGVPDPRPAEEAMPATIAELLVLLADRQGEVKRFIDAGDFGAVYVPALSAKDAALALESRLSQLPDGAAAAARAAIHEIVLTAWRLDAEGDLGNAVMLAKTYAAFSAAVHNLQSAYASLR
jgi:hypothetical protein